MLTILVRAFWPSPYVRQKACQNVFHTTPYPLLLRRGPKWGNVFPRATTRGKTFAIMGYSATKAQKSSYNGI